MRGISVAVSRHAKTMTGFLRLFKSLVLTVVSILTLNHQRCLRHLTEIRVLVFRRKKIKSGH